MKEIPDLPQQPDIIDSDTSKPAPVKLKKKLVKKGMKLGKIKIKKKT